MPSSPNGPWRAMKTTRRGPLGGQAVECLAHAERPVGAERGRVVVGRGRTIVATMVRRQPPPGAGEVDADPPDRVAGRLEGVGHGVPRDDRDVVLGRRAAEEDDDRDRRGRRAHAASSSVRQPDQSPTNTTSKVSSVPVARRTSARTRSARRRTSAARTAAVVDDEVGMLGAHRRPALRRALEPDRFDERARARAVGRIAEDGAGARDAERLVGLAPVADLVEPLADRVRRGGLEGERRAEDDLAGRIAGHCGLPIGARRGDLEPALPVAEPELVGGESPFRAVLAEDDGRLDDAGDVRAVSPGVGPHRPAHRAGDGEAELEARQARLLGHRGRPGHRQAGVGDEPPVADLGALGAILDDQSADAGVGDHDVAAAAEEQVRDAAGPGELQEAPQLEAVVGHGEQVGRSADPHRRESGQRLVARGLHPDPPLDVRPGAQRIEHRGRHAATRASRSMASASGSGRPSATARMSAATAAAAPGRPERLRGGRHPGVRRPVVEQGRRREEGRRVERLVADEPGGSRVGEGARVGELVAGRMRVRDDDHRQRRARRPRRGSTSRPGRRRGRPRRGPGPCRREGTGTGDSGRAAPPAGPRGQPGRPRSRRRR